MNVPIIRYMNKTLEVLNKYRNFYSIFSQEVFRKYLYNILESQFFDATFIPEYTISLNNLCGIFSLWKIMKNKARSFLNYIFKS